ncbi:zinc-binding dehydrogenase [Actibacterium sp. D379-3]
MILDLGKGAFPGYARALNMGARVVIYGSTGGPKFEVNAPEFFLRHATIHGTAMGNLDDFAAMLAFVGEKQIAPVIEQTYAIGDVAAAFADLQGGHFGKIVVTI